ncbi:MAG: glycosyltransferase [Flavobacteriales bacterium]|nr:glycosyltransferase [Flavobacteriales bacterium]MBP7156348.1 glycosyltransferase [Flavobacteriales bacterium]HQV74943.1 glycosyltransferase [Flavobacteriales bacterium]HQW41322.1 glycosyltransferase [Flavobacteriales bacterium]
MFNGARILVAPLDWGLGHATRCIPIIRRLLQHGAVPVIGADGGPLTLLSAEFPELENVRIPGLAIHYGKGTSQLWTMARQFPAMARSVQKEHAAFERTRVKLKLDAVISDQRFGIRSSSLPSIVITHQVFPFTPFAQGALRKLNLRQLTHFDRCWIMDQPEATGLAGELSHGEYLPKNARYIGISSRMVDDGSSQAVPKKKYRIVAVISGPEPQRTILENILLPALQRIEGMHLLVRGLPDDTRLAEQGNVSFVPHLSGKELSAVMRDAELIISRSGYTTLMDLVALDRTALVIPTPGQDEQEYLARLHRSTGLFIVQNQNDLDLNAALAAVRHRKTNKILFNGTLLDDAMEDLSTLL